MTNLCLETEALRSTLLRRFPNAVDKTEINDCIDDFKKATQDLKTKD